jgi:NTP pyrophosphatase (non-canonical NTP hydrolase)
MKQAWFGIFKLLEEMGELQQVLGKLGPFPDGLHPDGRGDLCVRLQEEVADVLAALTYFIDVNKLPGEDIVVRVDCKLKLYEKWKPIGVQNE